VKLKNQRLDHHFETPHCSFFNKHLLSPSLHHWHLKLVIFRLEQPVSLLHCITGVFGVRSQEIAGA
jgi:hypothetical protein